MYKLFFFFALHEIFTCMFGLFNKSLKFKEMAHDFCVVLSNGQMLVKNSVSDAVELLATNLQKITCGLCEYSTL